MAKIKGKKPPCATCKMPKLFPENQFVYLLISKYLSLFVNGMGGLSPEGIKFVMDIEKIIPEDRPLIIRKITVYILMALKVQQETKHG